MVAVVRRSDGAHGRSFWWLGGNSEEAQDFLGVDRWAAVELVRPDPVRPTTLVLGGEDPPVTVDAGRWVTFMRDADGEGDAPGPPVVQWFDEFTTAFQVGT